MTKTAEAHDSHVGSMGGHDGLEAKLGGLTTQLKDFQESPHYKLLTSGANTIASRFYDANKNPETGELILTEDLAKKLAQQHWDSATTMVGLNYLKLSKEAVDKLKEVKDPASGKSQWDTMMADHLGTDVDRLYETLKGRSVVKPEEIATVLARPIYEPHAQVFTSKVITNNIKTMTDAEAVLRYVAQLKRESPRQLESVAVPTAIKSVEDAQRLYGAVVGALHRDYKPAPRAAGGH